MRVDMARIDEIRAVCVMGKESEKEWAHVKIDPEYAIKKYAALCASGLGGLLVLRDDDGVIRGALGYVITEDLHYPEKLALETFWFVSPEYRGDGVKLLDAFEMMARLNGCAKMGMGHVEVPHPAGLELLYRRRKYKVARTLWLKEL